MLGQHYQVPYKEKPCYSFSNNSQTDRSTKTSRYFIIKDHLFLEVETSTNQFDAGGEKYVDDFQPIIDESLR